jgi:two-component sensor histidine kinase/CHASE3 domain sensor protein
MQDLHERALRPSRALLITIALSFVLLLAAVVMVMRSSIEADQADRMVLHTLAVKRHVAHLVTNLTLAESGQRGFLITDDNSLLAPLAAARREVSPELAALRKLVADNPDQVQRIDALRPAIDKRLAVAQDVVDLYRQGRRQEAAKIVATRGQQLMLECRSLLTALDEAENELLIARQQRVAQIRAQFVSAVTAMLIAGGTLAVFAMISLRRYISALAESRARLATYNVELEERVSQRTAELAHAAELAIRERNRAESLLTDVNHRVGNHLALVSSFLTMQQRTVRHPDAVRALEAARSRVQTIASAHRKLRLGADFASVRANELLGAVIDDIAAGLPPGELIRIQHQVEPLEINARDAVSLGVLASELVMNAAKHAFPLGEAGEVKVIFGAEGAPAPFLEVTDNGVGWHAKHTQDSGGLGGKIIEMVSRQFGGRLERSAAQADAARPGTRVRIDLTKLQFIDPG